MDQRNERFVPHVLRGDGRHRRRLPEQRPHLPQRVLAVARQAFRSRPICRRQVEERADGSARRRPRVLRHSLAHECVHPRLQSSVLRRHRRRGTIRAAVSCPPGTYTVVGWYEGEARVTRAVVVPPAAGPKSTWWCPDARAGLDHQPHLPGQRAAGDVVDRRGGLLRQRPHDQRDRSGVTERPRRSGHARRRPAAAPVREFRPHGAADRRPAEIQGRRRHRRSGRRWRRSPRTTSPRRRRFADGHRTSRRAAGTGRRSGAHRLESDAPDVALASARKGTASFWAHPAGVLEVVSVPISARTRTRWAC